MSLAETHARINCEPITAHAAGDRELHHQMPPKQRLQRLKSLGIKAIRYRWSDRHPQFIGLDRVLAEIR